MHKNKKYNILNMLKTVTIMILRFYVSSKKIKIIGWEPKNKLIKDLPEIINWYKKNLKL